MVDRRKFIRTVAGGLLVAPYVAKAELQDKVWRVGILDPGIPHLFAAFLESMRKLGYVEGQSIRYDVRSAEGKPEPIPALAVELVRLNPDVIVTAASLSIRVVMRTTATIPIVAVTGDAISSGVASSFAQPRGNITGVSFLNTELSAKRIEVLKEALPQLRKVAILNDLSADQNYVTETRMAAKRLRLELQQIDVRNSDDFEPGYQEAKRGAAEAIDVLASAFFNANRVLLVQLSAQYRLPAIYESREYVEAGGLMTYGQDLFELFRRAATYVDKILKGAKPSDLPWEQPTKFELVINLKTAKMLGLTIPQSLLLRADEVIRW